MSFNVRAGTHKSEDAENSVTMEMYDDYGQTDIFSNLTNPEHALQSPNALLLSTSQNIYMYEQDCNPSSTKQESVPGKASCVGLSDNVFEFPNPEEMAQLGCSPVVDNCWPDTPLLAGSLDGSLNESGVCFSWDLSDDDQEGLFPVDASPFCSAPTLAELNLEDTQSVDNGVIGKKKAEDQSLTSMMPLGQQEMSLSPQSWKRVKTEAVELASVDKRTKTSDVPKLSSSRPGSSRKSSKTKSSKPLTPKNNRTQESSKTSADAKKSALSFRKVHPSKIDFTELFWKRYRSRESIPSPTKEMSRSELIARTPNPFGNRRFLGRNALLKVKTQSSPKVAQTPKTVGRTVKPKANHRVRTKKPSTVAQKKKKNKPLALVTSEDSSQDRLWNDLKVFMYGDEDLSSKNKMIAPHRTLLPELDLKSESSKSPRTNMSSDPDSHDEGLGSENEDHDDFVSDDSDDDDDDDIQDDASDLSDDPGLPSTSTKHSSGKDSTGSLATRRRRVKTRRSEYDDFTPNPRKLLNIGHELNKLNLTISSLCPGNEASNDEKNQTRREKNKLASRACRLKKKAQHEANKVKHWGLVEEAKQLKLVLGSMRKEMITRLDRPKASWDYSLGAKLDHLIKNSLGHMVAGHTSEFVNSVLEKTAKGIPLSNLRPKLS
nr:CREB3 regulatory factor-like [Lytechinus pictus]